MRLLHYSAEPLGQLFPREQVRETKPQGLWISVEGPDDWPSWCRSEEWELNRLACASEITLVEGARVLWLIDTDEVRAFSRWSTDRWEMDWPAVAARWDGLFISPYQWACRLDPACHWYYGWDCASGCVWHPRAIRRVRRLEGETR